MGSNVTQQVLGEMSRQHVVATSPHSVMTSIVGVISSSTDKIRIWKLMARDNPVRCSAFRCGSFGKEAILTAAFVLTNGASIVFEGILSVRLPTNLVNLTALTALR